MNDDAPNLADHDKPNPGYLLNCSRYQKLVENANKKSLIKHILPMKGMIFRVIPVS